MPQNNSIVFPAQILRRFVFNREHVESQVDFFEIISEKK